MTLHSILGLAMVLAMVAFCWLCGEAWFISWWLSLGGG